MVRVVRLLNPFAPPLPLSRFFALPSFARCPPAPVSRVINLPFLNDLARYPRLSRDQPVVFSALAIGLCFV